MKEKGEKYCIVFFLKGSAKKHHIKLSNKLSDIFGVARVSEKIDPHITLKGFTSLIKKSEIEELKILLQNFCKRSCRVNIKLKGIGKFTDKVIFIEVIPTKEMKKLYKNFVKELEKLKWIKWNKYDKENMHFHATLVANTTPNKFKKIYETA